MLKVVPFQHPKVQNVKGADVIELWFDRFDEKETKKVLKKIKKPFIYKVEPKGLKASNIEALKKATYIDVDLSTTPAKIKELKAHNPKIRLIISHHDFKKTPPTTELRKLSNQMKSKKADIHKIATFAKNFEDAIRMLDFLSETSKKGQHTVFLSMGEKGIITRTTGHLFGNHMSYFALDEKSKSAPGQITLKEFNSTQ
jgi:3-dehydroquinate dehydratase type I